MSSLPQKSIKGAVFKTWAIQSIDKLIDYLSGTFIRGGKGISVRRSAGVTIIELEKQPEQVQQNATGVGATQDISATTGNNPSIELSGSTSSVQFVGTGDVTISGNTNGQIEIGVSGGTEGGMPWPDWDRLVGNPISLSWTSGSPMVASHIVPQNAWLKLDFAPVFNLNSAAGYQGHIIFDVDADGEEIYRYDKIVETDNTKLYIDDEHTQMIPVKAGALLSFAYTGSGAGDPTPSLSVYLYY